MPKLLSKAAIESVRTLVDVAADENNRYQIDCIQFEPSKIGMLGVATDGIIIVAKKLEGIDFPPVEESKEGNFPDWRPVLSKVGDDAICFAVNPILLIRALEAVMSFEGAGKCDECGIEPKTAQAVVISIQKERHKPIGICNEAGSAIASVMLMSHTEEECRSLASGTLKEFAESKLP
ncbi:MAG: hypothetical protein IT427_06465 [Pirellulales bacterium]|nr:hypothetical protein [Pirellulales bacterium]